MITDADGLLRFLNNCLPETEAEAEQSACGACLYREQCQDFAQVSVPIQWLEDVRAYLKAQTPRLLTLEEVLAWAETQAEKRDPIFFEQKEGKGPNGWICNSLCPKDYYLCCFDKDARCWTSRPTDEQLKAVKWE